MAMQVTETQRAELVTAMAAERRVRRWKRYRAVLLRAEGMPVATVASTVQCSEASVYGWSARWRHAGVAGLREGAHGGGRKKLDAMADARLEALLTTSPQAHGHQATGWTVALVRTELTAAGYPVGERTIRRAIHRLGYRWKRPQYVLGRPDPAYPEKRGP
jgi:transposase